MKQLIRNIGVLSVAFLAAGCAKGSEGPMVVAESAASRSDGFAGSGFLLVSWQVANQSFECGGEVYDVSGVTKGVIQSDPRTKLTRFNIKTTGTATRNGVTYSYTEEVNTSEIPVSSDRVSLFFFRTAFRISGHGTNLSGNFLNKLTMTPDLVPAVEFVKGSTDCDAPTG